MTPLQKFIASIFDIAASTEADRVLNVVEQIQHLPEAQRVTLRDASAAFTNALATLNWPDVAHWIQGWIRPYHEGLQEVADAAAMVDKLTGHKSVVHSWKVKLKSQMDLQRWQPIFGQRILCGFSSAVDATFDLTERGSLDLLVDHAVGYLRTNGDHRNRSQLLQDAYKEYCKDRRMDRKEVSTVTEALAALMFAYRNPAGNLKPTLKPQSETKDQGKHEDHSNAEDWMRNFYLDQRSMLKLSGGGASLNIADALAGLGFFPNVFWPYHPSVSAGVPLPCTGSASAKIQRCWFDKEWAWKQSEFSTPGEVAEETGCAHPVRISMVMSFSRNSEQFPSEIPAEISATGPGRLIFQFKGYRSAGFFEPAKGPGGNWSSPARFGRWHWESGVAKEQTEDANSDSMASLPPASYHRVILSAFQHADPIAIQQLGKQCEGMRLHHEISAGFDTKVETERYCAAIDAVFKWAKVATAGMNEGELAAFTKWQGTKVFSAAQPAVSDSHLQRLFRAMRVREAFDLDWMYVHGNDIDLTVVSPGKEDQFVRQLQNAMLLAKAAVFAALHLRSRIPFDHIPEERRARFEPSFSPKGFLALYQFARDFATQYGSSPAERDELQRQLITDGYVVGRRRVPSVVTVPVYWPDPEPGCTMTGAGDICSGVMAAAAP